MTSGEPENRSIYGLSIGKLHALDPLSERIVWHLGRVYTYVRIGDSNFFFFFFLRVRRQQLERHCIRVGTDVGFAWQ
jgi:hypothetical protein